MKELKYRLVSVGSHYDRPLLDVVFVHGLTGGPYTTWNGVREEPEEVIAVNAATTFERFDSGLAGEKYWPSWLDEDLRKDGLTSINLWSLGYPAPLLLRDDPLGYPESLRTGVRPLITGKPMAFFLSRAR